MLLNTALQTADIPCISLGVTRCSVYTAVPADHVQFFFLQVEKCTIWGALLWTWPGFSLARGRMPGYLNVSVTTRWMNRRGGASASGITGSGIYRVFYRLTSLILFIAMYFFYDPPTFKWFIKLKTRLKLYVK